MKEIAKEKLGCFSPGQPVWVKNMIDRILTEICPKCGCDTIITKGPEEAVFIQCPERDWVKIKKTPLRKNYGL